MAAGPVVGLGSLRRPGNVQAVNAFAGIVAGLIFVITLSYWSRRLFHRYYRTASSNAGSATWVRPISAATRVARSVLLRKVPGFTSGGHALMVGIYLAVNLILAFTNVFNYRTANSYASRFGWMILANLCVTVFLALKNTPLAFLTPYSYERLNVLHQAAGYLTIFWTVAHALAWVGYFSVSGDFHVFNEEDNIAGAVSGVAMLLMWFAFAVLRRYSYELFYVTHVALFILAIITMAIHRPSFTALTIIGIALAGAAWAADKLIRLARFMIYSVNNTATITPLPDGGTRVVLAKTPLGAAPGKHIFLWIPKLRALEMHPFSIVSTNPTELVINSYNGFTRSLHEKAKQEPGSVLSASMEGPYGTFPDLLEFDRIVLIAGGSGASFTFGLAVNALERMSAESTTEIIFVWAVKETDHLDWFTDHLNTILTHENAPKVKVAVHITQGDLETRPSWPLSSSEKTLASPASGSVDQIAPKAAESKTRSEKKEEHIDVEEKIPLSRVPSSVSSILRPGRPNVEAEIQEAIQSTPKTQRVLVAACGPSPLMKTVRNTTAGCIKPDAPSIELHLEQFGW